MLADATVLIIIPGPNILYMVTRGVHQGRAAGIASALERWLNGVVYISLSLTTAFVGGEAR